MKKYLVGGVLGFALLVFSNSAWSLTITGGVEVGDVDALIASTVLVDSGDATELAWVDSLISGDVVFGTKTDFGTDAGETLSTAWKSVVDNPGVYAFDLFSNGGYFLIKTGSLGSNPNRHFLFENLPDTSYAVINLADLGISDISNIKKVSHISEFNASQVPEPGTLLLLGSGLLGLGLMRRRKSTNA